MLQDRIFYLELYCLQSPFYGTLSINGLKQKKKKKKKFLFVLGFYTIATVFQSYNGGQLT